MKYLVYISLVLTLLFGACSDPLDPVLDRAEALVDSHPDSAYALLSETPWPSISSEQRRARYGLIATQALTSLYAPPQSDSMISAALEYYDRTGTDDPVRLAKTLYYASIARDEAGHPAQAFAFAMRARDLADSLNIDLWSGRIWSLIGSIYVESFDYFHALLAYKSASEKFHKAGPLPLYQYSIVDRAMLYGSYGESSEGIDLLDSLEIKSSSLPDGLADYILLTYAVLNTQSGNPQRALEYLDSISSGSDYFSVPVLNRQYNEIKVLPLIQTGRLAEADSLIKEISLYEEDDEFELPKFKYQYYKSSGQPDSALLYHEKHTDKLYDMVRSSMANSALSAGVDYYKAQYRAKEREQADSRKKSVMAGALILIVLAVVSVGVWMRIRRQARELSRRKDEIAALSEDADNNLRRVADLEKALASSPDRHAEMERTLSRLSDKYSDFDRLVSSGAYSASLANEASFKEFYAVTRDIFSPENIDAIQAEIDIDHSGIISEMTQECPSVSDEMRRLMVLVIFGIGFKTLSIVFNKTPGNIHTSLSRIRTVILQSGWDRAEEFCALLRQRQ